MTVLYEFGDSPCCMKVKLALEEKGLPYERRFVTSWKFDHYQPEYQAINPLSLVPTLVDSDGTTVNGSAAMSFPWRTSVLQASWTESNIWQRTNCTRITRVSTRGLQR